MPAFEGPRAAPTVKGGLLVAVGQWGELACLEAATGKELWRKDYTEDFGGKSTQLRRSSIQSGKCASATIRCCATSQRAFFRPDFLSTSFFGLPNGSIQTSI